MYSKQALIFNNKNIDREIKGYTTINVDGRGLIAPNIETQSIVGRDGDIILNTQHPPRDIVVYFMIKAPYNSIFIEKLKELTELLHSDGDVPFSFGDEEGIRYGRVAEISDPPYDSNEGIGSFTIHCSDPYLYRNRAISAGTISRVKYNKYSLDIVSVTATTASSTLNITNTTTGRKIILNNLSSGQKVVITKNTITVNGQNAMNKLDFVNSDYHEFKIYGGDTITTNGTNLKIEYRERIL